MLSLEDLFKGKGKYFFNLRNLTELLQTEHFALLLILPFPSNVHGEALQDREENLPHDIW